MPLHSCAEPNSIKFDFGATAASDGVLASNFIREPHGKQFAKKICVLNSRTLSKSESCGLRSYLAVTGKQIHSVFAFRQAFSC